MQNDLKFICVDFTIPYYYYIEIYIFIFFLNP